MDPYIQQRGKQMLQRQRHEGAAMRTMTYTTTSGERSITVTYSSDVESLGEFMLEAKAAFASEGHSIDVEAAEAAYLKGGPKLATILPCNDDADAAIRAYLAPSNRDRSTLTVKEGWQPRDGHPSLAEMQASRVTTAEPAPDVEPACACPMDGVHLPTCAWMTWHNKHYSSAAPDPAWLAWAEREAARGDG